MFDFLSVMERKNPLGLIEAFCAGVSRRTRGRSLVLKTINGDSRLQDLERLRRRRAGIGATS